MFMYKAIYNQTEFLGVSCKEETPISFGISLTHSLTHSQAAIFFKKGECSTALLDFRFLNCSLRTMEHFKAPYIYNLNKSLFKLEK